MITSKDRPYKMGQQNYAFVADSTKENSLKIKMYEHVPELMEKLKKQFSKTKNDRESVEQQSIRSTLYEQENAAAWGWSEQVVDELILKDEETGEELAMQEVSLGVSLSKEIVSTPMVAYDGTIKELITNGDYSINISGAIVSTGRDALGNETNAFSGSDKYPEEGVRALLRMCTAQRSLRATSDFLQLFDINCIVIQNFDLKQPDGGSLRQEFQISAISDVPYTIRREEV